MLEALGAVLELILGIGEILFSIAEFCAWIGGKRGDNDRQSAAPKHSDDIGHKDLRELTWKEWIYAISVLAVFCLYLVLSLLRSSSRL